MTNASVTSTDTIELAKKIKRYCECRHPDCLVCKLEDRREAIEAEKDEEIAELRSQVAVLVHSLKVIAESDFGANLRLLAFNSAEEYQAAAEKWEAEVAAKASRDEREKCASQIDDMVSKKIPASTYAEAIRKGD